MPVDQLDAVERYLLLLLYAPDHTDKFAQPVRGRTWLQKEMFLLSKLTGELEEKTEYDPNIMGSYSQIVDEVEDQFYISEYEERLGDSMKLSLEGKRLAEEVWSGASVPHSLRKRLALTIGDKGVDGVFETQLGDYHAYQAKFRTGRPSLTWDELSTFIGLADRVEQRVLFTNCDRFADVVKQRTGFYAITGNDLDKLEPQDFAVIRAWLEGARIERQPKNPLPHQAQAIDNLLPALRDQNRATALIGVCETDFATMQGWFGGISLPYAVPYIFTGIKLAVAYSFIGVIGAELIMSRTGLGYEIGYAYNNFDNAVMYPLIVLVLAIAATVNTLFFLWEKKMLARRRR